MRAASALDQDRGLIAALYLTLLALVFVGMATIVLKMVHGQPETGVPAEPRESWWAIFPPLILLILVLCLGRARKHLPVALPYPFSFDESWSNG